MVSKLKRLWWKIQDMWSSLALRAEVDMFFHLASFVLTIVILVLVIKIWFAIQKLVG